MKGSIAQVQLGLVAVILIGICFDSQTSDQHAFTIYFFDSHAYANPEKTEYDIIKEDQLQWYLNVSQSFAKENGKPPNALAFFHIPIPEYNNLQKDDRQRAFIGDKRETVSSSKDNNVSVLSAFLKGKLNNCIASYV
jgi:hypothetical protein